MSKYLAGAIIIGAAITYYSAKKTAKSAASAQNKGTEAAIEAQGQADIRYDQQIARYNQAVSPYLQAGYEAMGYDPSYFQSPQGQQEISAGNVPENAFRDYVDKQLDGVPNLDGGGSNLASMVYDANYGGGQSYQGGQGFIDSETYRSGQTYRSGERVPEERFVQGTSDEGLIGPEGIQDTEPGMRAKLSFRSFDPVRATKKLVTNPKDAVKTGIAEHLMPPLSPLFNDKGKFTGRSLDPIRNTKMLFQNPNKLFRENLMIPGYSGSNDRDFSAMTSQEIAELSETGEVSPDMKNYLDQFMVDGVLDVQALNADLARMGMTGGDLMQQGQMAGPPEMWQRDPDAPRTGMRLFSDQGTKNLPILQQYADAGPAAFQQQQAISGALGPEAQAQAIEQIQSGSMMSAMAGQAENSILQNAAATGGLRGGNTAQALATASPGILNQLMMQQYGMLGDISSTGGNVAQFLAGMGQSATSDVAHMGLSAAAGTPMGAAGASPTAGLLQSQGASNAALNIAQGQNTANVINSGLQAFGTYMGGRSSGGGGGLPANSNGAIPGNSPSDYYGGYNPNNPGSNPSDYQQ